MFMPALDRGAADHGRSACAALAVTSRERLPALRELPTVSESGLKGYESSQW